MKKNYFLSGVFFCLILISAQAQITDIVQFNGTNGAYPYGSLNLLGDRLFGMTYGGGDHSAGCVFAVDSTGANYKVLLSFNDTTGLNPRGSLLLYNGMLYGMTTLGGGTDLGNIFKIDTGGNNFKTLLDFTPTQGRVPWGSLIILGGDLYGMTNGGGVNGQGAIFSIDTNGNNYRKIYDFGDTVGDGTAPYGDLLFVGNKFYGTTDEGGANHLGTLFSIDTSGKNYKVLFSFGGTSYPQGANPKGSLTYANGVLYGMTSVGGANSEGVIFSVDTDGMGFKDLLDFNGTNGNQPQGSLLLQGGTLFGTTYTGGSGNAGLVFSIDTDGSNYSNLADFNETDGGGPAGALTLSKGALYGTTYQDGPSGNYGVVFSTNICNLKVSVNNGMFSLPCYGESTGQAVAAVTQGSPPYAFQWSGGVGTGDTVRALSAGTYTLSLTDNYGCTDTTSFIISQPSAPLTAISDSTPQSGSSCNGAAAVLASGGTPPYTYQWQTGLQTTDSIAAQCAGTYCCQIMDSNQCFFNTCITINQVNGINNVNTIASINIYPEPTTGNFSIEGLMIQEIVEIYDYSGRKLSTGTANGATMHFNISDWPSGVYLMRILSKEGIQVGEKRLEKVQ